MATAKVALKRLDCHDWLVQGMETLRRSGIDAVRVEPMARALGVTKGSFYWHFKDRGEFLDRLLQFWEAETTDRIKDHVASLHGDPREELLALCELITHDEIDRYDAAVRAWALYDERAGEVVKQVDEKRLGHLRDLFRDMGFSPEEADMRSRICYFYMLGDLSAFLDGPSVEERVARVRLRHNLLTDG